MTSQFSYMASSSKFFWRGFVSLMKFSYWSKFHVNIITDSGVMTIFFYKVLTRNPEIGNTPVWVLPNIWRLGRVRNTKFGTNVSIEMRLNAANARVTAFLVSELLRENQQDEGGRYNYPPPRLGLKTLWKNFQRILTSVCSAPKNIDPFRASDLFLPPENIRIPLVF